MNLQERAQRIQLGLASPQDYEGLSTDDIIAIKGDQSEMHYRFVGGTHAVEEIKAVGEESGQRFRHVASDESVDAVGDIISVGGWELNRFQKNPVLLWAHDQRSLPIGVVNKVWKGRAEGKKALMTESSFHGADLNPHAELVKGLVEAGALPGVSVGFIPKEFVFPKTEEERRSIGLGEFGVLHVKQELIELSVVPVPANGNALRKKMIERAEPVFANAQEMGFEADMVELVKHALNLTWESERDIRRRTIIVAEGAHAVVRDSNEVDVEVEVTKEVAPVEAAASTEEAPAALEQLITKLTDSVNTLSENLTKASTVATTTADSDQSADEISHEPAGPGEDFMLQAIKAASEQFSN